jgi:hypothetical protein
MLPAVTSVASGAAFWSMIAKRHSCGAASAGTCTSKRYLRTARGCIATL